MSLLKKLSFLLITFIFVVTPFLISPSQAYAEIQGSTVPGVIDENTATLRLKFTGLNPSLKYDILDRNQRINHDDYIDIEPSSSGEYTPQTPVCGATRKKLKTDCNTSFNDGDWFDGGTYRYIIRESECNCNEREFTFNVTIVNPVEATFFPRSPRPGNPIIITLSGSKRAAAAETRNDYIVRIIDRANGETVLGPDEVVIPANDSITVEFEDGLGEGRYRLEIEDLDGDYLVYKQDFTVDRDGGTVEDPIIDRPTGDGFAESDTTGGLTESTKKVVNFLLRFAIGIAGGLALLLLVYGGFKLIFSAGNPEAVTQGKEILTGAIIGLLVVVFSVFLLRLIGISILGLPI